MDSKAIGNGWSLQVVRGREPGRVFALGVGEFVLGNAPGDRKGIDLASQEGDNSPRRMAARHASLDCSNGVLALRDLESPGGTFVNRQRILPGQAKGLKTGDVIQLGGVQLEVVASMANGATPTVQPASSSGAFSYAIPGGPVCRSWDDVLTASAQRWEALREELVSGRLASFLVSIGRPELAPSPRAAGSPDDRLDAWLGSLPVTREARPELDVHPNKLVIKVAPGGGSVRRTIRVANVGLRLLRSSARVEPPGTSWLAIAPEFATRPFVTVEETELALDVAIPETLAAPLKAEVIIDGNGGSKRVSVILEAKAAQADFAGSDAPTDQPASSVTLGDLIARQSPTSRVVSWALVALAVRLLVGVVSGSIGEDAMVASGPDSPGLGRVALMLAGVGGLLGGIFASRRGGAREAPTGAFAGGCAGVIVASSVVAACRSVEPSLGTWSTSVVAACAAWALIGAALAALSILVVKGKS
jgi:FHA domain